MATSNHFGQEEKEKMMDKFLDDSPNELSFLPEVQNGTFLNDGDYNFSLGSSSPSSGDVAPSNFFPTLMEAVEDEDSDIFYIINPTDGTLEEAGGPSSLQIKKYPIIDEDTEVVPSKRPKKEMSVYEETLIREFSAEIQKEQKLLQEEHEMRMKLWEIEMHTSQQQHALKMAILKEKLEKVQQEKENLQRERNEKYLGKFRSGPI